MKSSLYTCACLSLPPRPISAFHRIVFGEDVPNNGKRRLICTWCKGDAVLVKKKQQQRKKLT